MAFNPDLDPASRGGLAVAYSSLGSLSGGVVRYPVAGQSNCTGTPVWFRNYWDMSVDEGGDMILLERPWPTGTNSSFGR